MPITRDQFNTAVAPGYNWAEVLKPDLAYSAKEVSEIFQKSQNVVRKALIAAVDAGVLEVKEIGRARHYALVLGEGGGSTEPATEEKEGDDEYPE